MLLFPKASPSTRNKTGVAAIVKKAPAGQHDLAWWIAWLTTHWDG